MRSSFRGTQTAGALVLLCVAVVGGWAYLDAKQHMAALSKDFAGWSEAESSNSGVGMHLHDTHSVLASPGWLIAAIVCGGLGLAAVLWPGLFAVRQKR